MLFLVMIPLNKHLLDSATMQLHTPPAIALLNNTTLFANYSMHTYRRPVSGCRSHSLPSDRLQPSVTKSSNCDVCPQMVKQNSASASSSSHCATHSEEPS